MDQQDFLRKFKVGDIITCNYWGYTFQRITAIGLQGFLSLDHDFEVFFRFQEEEWLNKDLK